MLLSKVAKKFPAIMKPECSLLRIKKHANGQYTGTLKQSSEL